MVITRSLHPSPPSGLTPVFLQTDLQSNSSVSDLYLPLVATPVSVRPLPLSGLRRSPTLAGISNSGSVLLLLLLRFFCQVHQWPRTFLCPTLDLPLATLPLLHLHTPSARALPPLVHSLRSCTSSALALPPVPLPPVPLPPVLDIAPDLTLVKSTSDPYLSCSGLVPLSLLFLHHPCNPSSPCLLPLRFIFLYLVYFPVCFCSVPCPN